jgi:azurin
MNIRLPLCLVSVAFSLSGCGQKETASAPAAAAPAPAAAPAAAPKAAAAPRVIEVTANDTMKFNVTLIEAKAGETIKIVFTNNGTLPKEAMGHNLVVLKPGTDGAAFSAAAMAAKATDYIPDSMKAQVVATTALLGPKKSDEIILKDLAVGEYPFVCSFPAHFAVGMKGVLSVK